MNDADPDAGPDAAPDAEPDPQADSDAEAEPQADPKGQTRLPARPVIIVVGAHPRAEQGDRPLAYRMEQAILDWARERGDTLGVRLQPQVCCDIWRLNDTGMRLLPTISLGGPGVNAFAAQVADKLAPVLVRDDRLVIQFDPDFVDLTASIWGMDHALMVEAYELFVSRHLPAFLTAVATQVEPDAE